MTWIKNIDDNSRDKEQERNGDTAQILQSLSNNMILPWKTPF